MVVNNSSGNVTPNKNETDMDSTNDTIKGEDQEDKDEDSIKDKKEKEDKFECPIKLLAPRRMDSFNWKVCQLALNLQNASKAC